MDTWWQGKEGDLNKERGFTKGENSRHAKELQVPWYSTGQWELGRGYKKNGHGQISPKGQTHAQKPAKL